jgi:hypothetical protein
MKHLADDYRYWLRQQQAWNDLRTAEKNGWMETFRRLWTWPRILATEPIRTETFVAGSPTELHVLCHGSDWLLAIWMLKSFLHYSGRQHILVIHLQKETKPSVQLHLAHHFPDARILLPGPSRQLVGNALVRAGLINCLRWWLQSPIMHKLFGVQILSASTNLVGLDADVLFFRRPDELLQTNCQPWPWFTFQQDQMDSYTLSREEASNQLGIPLAARVNTGIMVRAREALDLRQVEELLQSPLVAKPSGHLEQTLYALAGSATGRIRLLPQEYALTLDGSVDVATAACRHYAGPSKRWITTEGMHSLIRRGLLKSAQNT